MSLADIGYMLNEMIRVYLSPISLLSLWRTIRVEMERKRGGSEPEGARKAEGDGEREREV